MSRQNVEIKARCADLARVAHILSDLGARFEGIDHQTDTYFECPHGRFKLREGNIERALIWYDRADLAEPKVSTIVMTPVPAGVSLKPVLSAALGVSSIVTKERQIWYLGAAKIHLDRVTPLGTFVEIEILDDDGTATPEDLTDQCHGLMVKLGISRSELVVGSYRDLLQGRPGPDQGG